MGTKKRFRCAGGPKTVQQILDQQDELADKFESFDPGHGHEVSVEDYLERRSRSGGGGRE